MLQKFIYACAVVNCRLSRVDLIMIFAEQPAQILIYLHLTRKYHNSLSMLYDRKGLPSDSQYGLLCHLISLISKIFFSFRSLGNSSPHQFLSNNPSQDFKIWFTSIHWLIYKMLQFPTFQKYQFSLFYTHDLFRKFLVGFDTTTVNTNWRVILL